MVRPVEDQELVLADQRASVVRAGDRGHGEAPRDDRRVRGHAAEVGDEAGVAVRLELDHVRRRKIVRDEDRVLLGTGRHERARLAEEPLQDPLDHLHDVRLALAQIGVLDVLELLDQHVHLHA